MMGNSKEELLQLKYHLKAWERYEKVRLKGQFNMLDEKNVRAHASLTKYEYNFILHNYTELKDLHNELHNSESFPGGKSLPKHLSLEDQIQFLKTCERTSITQFEKDHYNAAIATLSRLPKGAD